MEPVLGLSPCAGPEPVVHLILVNTCELQLDLSYCLCTTQDGKFSVAGSVDIAAMKKVLVSPEAAAFKILEVPSSTLEALSGLWATFQGKEKELFMQRLKHYTSVVCCLQQNPGWVW